MKRLLHAAKQAVRDLAAAVSPPIARRIEYYNVDRLTLDHLGTCEAELLLINDLIEPGTIAVDVGANVGHYVRQLEKSGRCSAIYALEPIPRLQRRLRALFPRVHVLPLAASDVEEMRTLRIPRIGGVPYPSRGTLANVREEGETGFDEVIVETARLDDVIAGGRVGFIKIDVEGHESEVIAGAMRTILRDRPLLLVEIEERHHPGRGVADVAHSLLVLGYSVSFFEKASRTMRPLAEFDPHTHQRADAFGTPAYHNNFFFFPPRTLS